MKAMLKRMLRPVFRATKNVLRPLAKRMRGPLSRLLYPPEFERAMRDLEVIASNLKGYLEQNDQTILALFRTLQTPQTDCRRPAFSAVPLSGNRLLATHPAAPFILLDGLDLIDTPRIISGQYLPHMTRVLQQLVKPGDTFVDLGAGCGFHTLTMATASGKKAAGFAVEFDNHKANILRDNLIAANLTGVSVFNGEGNEAPALAWLSDALATAQRRPDVALVRPGFRLDTVPGDVRRRLFDSAGCLLLADHLQLPELIGLGHRFWTISAEGTLFNATPVEIEERCRAEETHFVAARSLN
jgi:hypothetical protein